MSAASYNRGSAAISRQLDAELPSHEMTLLRDLTTYSAQHSGTRPFAATVVRFGPGDGQVAIMSRQRGGWAAFCYWYDSPWALARAWRLVFTGFGQDEHGRFMTVEPGDAHDGATA